STNIYASSFFPWDSRPDRHILVWPLSFGNDPHNTPEGILRHELGHILGFRHEHARPENGHSCPESDSDLRPLTVYDNASVMMYPFCNGVGDSLELTQYDKLGVARLYGLPGTSPPVAPLTTEAIQMFSGMLANTESTVLGPLNAFAGHEFN